MAVDQLTIPWAEICEYCGEIAEIDLFEAWGHDFQIEYCCEDAQESWEFEQQYWSNQEWTEFLRSLPSGELIPHHHVAAGEGRVRLHFGLRLDNDPAQALCRDFILAHHRHLPKVTQWRWGHAVYNGRTLIGVAWVGTPVSRVMTQRRFVEVNRCCVAVQAPSDLARNACSMLYGAAARRAKREGYAGIITYTRADETGVSVKASGFEILPMRSDKHPGIVRGKSWGHASRQREQHEIIDKTRWARRF